MTKRVYLVSEYWLERGWREDGRQYVFSDEDQAQAVAKKLNDDLDAGDAEHYFDWTVLDLDPNPDDVDGKQVYEDE